MTAPSSPQLGRRASDLAFVRDLVQGLWDEMVRPRAWAFEDMQEAGERAMRDAGRAYQECEGADERIPLSVYARPRILKACKEAVREVE
jgi:hypothetical protein